jgi:hypothetical protein
LKYSSFSLPTLLYDFLQTTTSSNTFQKALLYYFRRSSFLNIPPKPILQVEVLIFVYSQHYFRLLHTPTPSKYFSKGFIILFQNKFFP